MITSMGSDLFGSPLGSLGMFGALKNAGTGSYGAMGDVFARTLRFAVIDNGILVLSAIAGYSLDDKIAKVVGVKGYGALIGASVGNAISDGVAGLPEGKEAAKGYFMGAMLPVVPILAAVAYQKKKGGKEIDRDTKLVLGGLSVIMLAWAVFRRQRNRKNANGQVAPAAVAAA